MACCSQCVQAAQITFEDFFMADLAIPPLKIVGYEGVLGASAMLLLVLPIVQVCWRCQDAIKNTTADAFQRTHSHPPPSLFLLLVYLQRLPGVDGQGLHEDSVDTWHVRLLPGVAAGPTSSCGPVPAT